MDNIPDYLKKEANLKPVLIKLFTLIETHFNMTPNIEIMILGDGALWIKNTKNFMHQYFPKNKIHYTIDKFHLTSRFKKLYPYQSKNKENRETYHKTVDYFFNAKYEKLLQCLEENKSFISDAKLDFLNKTIRLCKVKMQIGQFALIKSIIYLLLKIATIFLKKNNFFKYKLIFKHDKKKTLLQIYNSYLKKLNINIF